MRTRREPRAPRPLFDPDTQNPPRDALELYLELPATVSIMFALAFLDNRPDLLPGIEDAREAGRAAVIKALAADTTMKVGQHYPLPSGSTVGIYSFGQIELTVVAHDEALGHTRTPWLHEHFYLGATGIADHDGGRWPVALNDLRAFASGLRAVYADALERALYDDPGWVLSGAGDSREITGVEPDLLASFPRPSCPPQHAGKRWHLNELARPPRRHPHMA